MANKTIANLPRISRMFYPMANGLCKSEKKTEIICKGYEVCIIWYFKDYQLIILQIVYIHICIHFYIIGYIIYNI